MREKLSETRTAPRPARCPRRRKEAASSCTSRGVTVERGTGCEAGTPGLVVEGSYWRMSTGNTSRTYDIAPDGQRFLMLKGRGSAAADDPFFGLTQIHVVLNWFSELQARVPTGQ